MSATKPRSRRRGGTTTASSGALARRVRPEQPAVAIPPGTDAGLLYRWYTVRSAAQAAGDAEDFAAHALRNYGTPVEVRHGLHPAGTRPDALSSHKDPLAGLRRLLPDVPLVWDPTLAPYGVRFGYEDGDRDESGTASRLASAF